MSSFCPPKTSLCCAPEHFNFKVSPMFSKCLHCSVLSVPIVPSSPSFFTKVLNQTAMQVYWELPSRPGALEGFRLEYRGVSNPQVHGQETFPAHINTHTISDLGQCFLTSAAADVFYPPVVLAYLMLIIGRGKGSGVQTGISIS